MELTIKKEGHPMDAPLFLLSGRLLIQSDSTSRASGSASTTLDAFIGIDFVDVAFGNSSDRAFASTCTTCYARIRNFVSHSLII